MKNIFKVWLLSTLLSLGFGQVTGFPELVKNGTFNSDGNQWTLWNWTDPQGRAANVKATYKNGIALLDFSQHVDYPTFEYWAVTWSTGPVTLERRQWYRLQFEAWGSDSTGFNVAILGPWDEVKLTQNFYLSRRSPTVTKQKQLFVYEFRHSYSGLNNDGRISIQMARSPAESLYFDNISLKGISEDSLTSPIGRSLENKLSIKPSLRYLPENQKLVLSYPTENTVSRINAFSMNGNLLRTWHIRPQAKPQQHFLNGKGLPLGMVLFSMESETATDPQKLLITP